MSTSMQSSALLSNPSSSENDSGHLDSTSSHDSRPVEQKSGVIYRVKTLATQLGFFSPDSLKTVSTFINVVPTKVVCIFFLQLTYHMNTLPDCPATNTCHQFVPPVTRNWWPFSGRKRFLVAFNFVYLTDLTVSERNQIHGGQSRVQVD